jgi:hypothetical protein
MFKSKKQKMKEQEERRLSLANEIRLKEIKAKMTINRTLDDLRTQSKKLNQFKAGYIEKAREALRVNHKESYQMAKTGLKLSLNKQRFLDSMIVNFEIAMQVNDMNEVIGSFVHGIDLISNQMKKITSSIDLLKAQESFEKAMINNVNQYDALNVFITSAAESMKTLEYSGQSISDSEIDQLITSQTIDLESDLDKEIEKKIVQVKEKLEAR